VLVIVTSLRMTLDTDVVLLVSVIMTSLRSILILVLTMLDE
jgi:hypothetical protein